MQVVNSSAAEQSKEFDFSTIFSQRNQALFSALGKLTYRDLNEYQTKENFHLYTKDQITKFLKDPEQNEKELRNAMIYIYNASSHIRRLIQYFATLTDLSYIIAPHGVNYESEDPKKFKQRYRKTIDLLDKAHISSQFADILTVCFREDTYFGTLRESSDGITLQQLPSEFCKITSSEDGVFNVSFDFFYFESRNSLLPFFSSEFQTKYKEYTGEIPSKNKGKKWIELDSPNSFAIKFNQDTPQYSTPPFAGVLREVYDIEDYKNLRLSRTELENYAMLVMTLGVDNTGNWVMDFDKAKEFWSNLAGVLPPQIGSILTPMKIDKISFDHSGVAEIDRISEAENNLWSAAGVSSMIFNSKITSSNALLTSIKADQALTYRVVKSIEAMLNRFLKSKGYSKHFHVLFLDTSRFNRKEVSDMCFKGCQYGMPLVSMYCASLGLNQSDMMSVNWLEDKVLNITSKFRPLQSSATMSGSSGRPTVDAEDLSDSGEASREQM